MKRHVYSAVIAAVGLLAPMASNAFEITTATSLGSTFTVNFLLPINATDPNGNTNTDQDISASVVFKLDSFNASTDTIGLQLDVKNTSANLGNNVGLQKLAFGTAPDAKSVVFSQITDGDVQKFISASLDTSSEMDNAVKPLLLDVESLTDTGYPRTLNEGLLDKFLLTISFDSIDDGVVFTPFAAKFQTGYGSFEFPGGNGGGGGGGGGGSAPEPMSLALFGIGLVGLGLARRRSAR